VLNNLNKKSQNCGQDGSQDGGQNGG